MLPTISFCTIMKNEEEYIEKCLESIKNIVTEIIIVDTGSTDKSIEIAKRYGAKIIYYDNKNINFSQARNLALNIATGDWILTLDADEMFYKKDVYKILELVKTHEKIAYYFPRYEYLKNGGWFLKKALKLFKNSPNVQYRRTIGENIIDSLEECSYKFCEVDEIYIHHYGKRKKTTQLYNKKNLYSELTKGFLKENPVTYPKMYGFLAESYLLTEDYVSALNNFKIAYEKAPSLYAYKRICDLYYKMGIYDKWIGGYRKLVTTELFDESSLNNTKGHYYFLIEQYEEAKLFYEQTMESCHKYINIGLCSERLGQYESAIHNFEMAVNLNPMIKQLYPLKFSYPIELFNDTNWAFKCVYNHLLFCYLMLGKTEEALNVLMKINNEECEQLRTYVLESTKRINSMSEGVIIKYELDKLMLKNY
ncbi:tetratricopeptide repeat-containing glycosyltransferase family 2 protein [Bacillus pseudomycoides]|uniref:tetratricopeptide repeat-containing glycosyltransferase family 2 protein n=1 Tax=Bacillus pseudomycoides TaxID=64104 RepID=UPI000BF57C81|nr:glycosyltransferase [Bacillus pseudomycoides]PEP84911.1 hypothetical protein CN584_13605 [Bacillus pseudomycoides]